MRAKLGITLKLSLLFITVSILPVTGIGVYSYQKGRDVLTVNAVEDFVVRVAHDTAQNVDAVLGNMSQETTYLATDSEFCRKIAKLKDAEGDPIAEEEIADQIRTTLNERALILGDIDLFVVTDLSGRILVTNSLARSAKSGRYATTNPAEPKLLWPDLDKPNPLKNLSPDDLPFWSDVIKGQPLLLDCRIEGLVQRLYQYPIYPDDDADLELDRRVKNPEAFVLPVTRGIPVYDDVSKRGHPNEGPWNAILIAYYNWSAIQDLLDKVDRDFAERHPRYRTGYAFMFRDDCDTIIGHKDRRNYLTTLSKTHGLGNLKKAMQDAGSRDGISNYVYKRPKISGFSTVSLSGWRVGFGIDEVDIFADVRDLRDAMIWGTLTVAVVLTILIIFVARRLTRPIQSLIRQTEEIARGNLDAKVAIVTGDEIETLGSSFNKMAEDLKASNKRLIQAEKTAAWREMARQVAHEIKNPLTPIKLSAQLIERAWRDRHQDFEKILKDSVTTIVSQTESLRKIASDFSNYATFSAAHRQAHSARKLIQELVKLYAGKTETGIEVKDDILFGDDVEVFVDADELKRVFLNLFNNAFEAMQSGGSVVVSAAELKSDALGHMVEIRVRDTGRGIPPDVQKRLFEPYFTTRTSGTGLGLAIAKKTIESYGGRIEISSAENVGTTVIMKIPVYTPPPRTPPPMVLGFPPTRD